MKRILSRFLPRMPRKCDRVIHGAVLLLIIFGFVMVTSTYAGKNPEEESLLKEVIQSIGFMGISYYMMTFMARSFKLERMRHFHWFIGVPLVIAMAATLLFTPVNGSKAWLYIAGFSIQPVEFVKVYMIVLLALYIELIKKSKQPLWKLIRVPVAFYVVFAGLILAQKDLGALVILTMIVLALLMSTPQEKFSGLQKAIFMLLGAAIIGVGFCVSDAGIEFLSNISFLAHIAVRFQNMLNPFLDTMNTGYQMINGLYGFARGGLRGVGLGQSIQKYGYLSQSESDFILSIIVEELGLLGLLIVVIGYFVIVYRLLYYAFKAKSEGYRFILLGTAVYIFAHFLMNVGGVSGLIPLTGVPLLFISSGGSSMVSIMSCIGIAQAVISIVRRSGSATKKKKRTSS